MRTPRIKTKNLISYAPPSTWPETDSIPSVVFCEVVGIYGVIGCTHTLSRPQQS